MKLIQFARNNHRQIVASVQGIVKEACNFESLKRAIQAASFSSGLGPAILTAEEKLRARPASQSFLTY